MRLPAEMDESGPGEEVTFNVARLFSDPEKLSLYLDLVCDGRPVLRQRVERLLKTVALADGYFERQSGVLPRIEIPFGTPFIESPIGIQDFFCGRYRLVKQLGEGGCGVVYEAEQIAPVRRLVAIKILKPGMDTRSVIARFEAERQALAMMDHPNIAKIHDGGTTEHGRPYFVMELVHGTKITDYCHQHGLSIRDRLDLFLQGCAAVEHAHHKGIIHRDLKPSNILVSHDYGAALKVIDFGIAKAIESKLTEQTFHTGVHQFLGTPAYMSPEQADLSPDVDTRSDIYSLGVLLYELLTSKPPFDNQELLSSGFDEMRRIIREVEPARPSIRFAGPEGRSAGLLPGIRRWGRGASRLSSDVDCIILKCLEKDRSRRYQTANALAADIAHFLHNEPILAQPPTSAYRLKKFVRRHRAASLGAVLVGFVITAALLVEARSLRRERLARAKALAQLSAATNFISDVFNGAAPEIADLVGAARAQDRLAQAGVRFLERLQSTSNENPSLRLELARVLVRSSLTQNPGRANTTGDFLPAFKAAEQAVTFLASPIPGVPEDQRLDQFFWAKWARVQALYGLGRWSEGIALSPDLEQVLGQLAAFPRFSQHYIERQRACIRLNAANALSLSGQPASALEQHLKPYLKTGWVEQFDENTCEEYELTNLAAIYDGLTLAYLLTEDYNAMLPASTAAVRIATRLLERFPRNARYQWGILYSHAHHGYALTRNGQAQRGLDEIEKARGSIAALARTDRSNDQLIQCQATITALYSLTWAVSDHDKTASAADRLARLDLAEVYLNEAREMAARAKSQVPAVYLRFSATNLLAARRSLSSPGRINQPEHPPPQTSPAR